MFMTELDTFVWKFYQLWNSGYNAHLDIETCAGIARVGVSVQIGHAPGLPCQTPPHPQKKSDTPSRQRRRARRTAARLKDKEDASKEKSGQQEPVDKDIEEANKTKTFL